MQKLWNEALQAFNRRAKPIAYLDIFFLFPSPGRDEPDLLLQASWQNIYAKRMTRSSIKAKKIPFCAVARRFWPQLAASLNWVLTGGLYIQSLARMAVTAACGRGKPIVPLAVDLSVFYVNEFSCLYRASRLVLLAIAASSL